MRLLRFGYIVPRVVALVILYLVAEVGCGYLLHWGVTSGGSAAIGAKVDLDASQVSLLETQLALGGLALTNPSDPMRNLVEIRQLNVDLDTSSLLRKKLVVNYGIVSGLQFDTDRETSGALPDVGPAAPGAPSWIAEKTHAAAERWFANLEARFAQDLRSQFKSIELAEQLAQKWPSKYKELESAVRTLKSEARRLEEGYKEARKNPLRHGEFLTRLPQDVLNLRDQLTRLQAELAALPHELQQDKLAIEQARRHDQQQIEGLAHLDQIDPQMLAEYLVGDQIASTVRQATSWLRFARKMVPPSMHTTETAAADGRGTNVVFQGAKPLPNVWVKRVRLEGSARLGGQPLELIGTLQDWSTDPRLVNRATTLQLQSKGGLPATVEASFDRSGEVPSDQLVLSASGMSIAGGQMGQRGPVRLEVSRSTADVLASLRLVGDQLTGKLEIRQQGLGVTPDITMAKIGDPLERALTSRLATIREGSTEVTLAGSLDSPEFTITSSLGTALAEAIGASAKEVATQYAQGLVARGQREVDNRLTQLEGEIDKFRAKIEEELGDSHELLAHLLESGGAPQLGRRLPGALFK